MCIRDSRYCARRSDHLHPCPVTVPAEFYGVIGSRKAFAKSTSDLLGLQILSDENQLGRSLVVGPVLQPRDWEEYVLHPVNDGWAIRHVAYMEDPFHAQNLFAELDRELLQEFIECITFYWFVELDDKARDAGCAMCVLVFMVVIVIVRMVVWVAVGFPRSIKPY